MLILYLSDVITEIFKEKKETGKKIMISLFS